MRREHPFILIASFVIGVELVCLWAMLASHGAWHWPPGPFPRPLSLHEAMHALAGHAGTASAPWIAMLTAVLAAIGVLQLVMFGWQGVQLRVAVRALRQIAERQGSSLNVNR